MLPNVILITIDCLRADHVSCLDYARETTPNIDRLAEKGLLFSTAISNGAYTAPSFPSILTSTYALMYPRFKENSLFISDERTSIAQVLKQHGYQTAAFHDNPHLAAYFGYDRGFDEFEDHIKDFHNHRFASRVKQKVKERHADKSRLYQILRNVKGFFAAREKKLKRYLGKDVPYQRAEIINQEAITWVSKNPKPFFLWIHYMDVHSPYLPPLSLFDSRAHYVRAVKLADKMDKHRESLSLDDVKTLIRLYDMEVKHVDYALGLFLEKLEELGISLEDTFFIITSDHGEEFMEHGGIGHGPKGVKPKLYDEIIHVPLIIAGPGLSHRRIDNQASLLDLAPTIVQLIGLERVKAFLGCNIVSPALPSQSAEERGVISEYQYKELRGYSYRTRKWKYILTLNGDARSEELYSLEKDSAEQRDLAGQMLSEMEKFRKIVNAHISMEKSVDLATLAEKKRIRRKINKIKKNLL